MKKIKNILALLVVALMGLSLTACSEDDLDTNQYQGGVHLNVYGPQPVMRGGQLRFLGSNLDQIAQVKIPGCDPITNFEIVKAGVPSEIKVAVPKDGPEVGYITLVTKTDEEITTKTKLTYEEPIVFEKFSPASVMPGETLSIEGDYLNLVHMVEFNDGVQIPEKDFVSHSRYKIEVVVPEEARTGKIGLLDTDLSTVVDLSQAFYNIIESEDAITIGTPTINKWSSPRGEAQLSGEVTAKMGETITITGEHFNLVQGIKFSPKTDDTLGQTCEISDFTISEDGKTLSFTLPEEAADGDLNLICRSGVEIPVGTINTVAPSECVATPSPVKAGAQLLITGKDLDVVNSIEMPNVSDAIEFIKNPDGTKLIIKSVPATAIEGNLVLRMKNGKGVEVPFSLVKPVVTGYDHNPVSAGGAITLKGTNLDLVTKVKFGEGSDEVEAKANEDGTAITITVPMNAVSGAPTLILANGTTVECPELKIEEAVFCYITELPDFSEKENMPEAGSTFTVPVKNGDKLESVFVNGKKVNHVYAEKPSTLTIGIPSDAGSSSVLKLVSSNGSIEYNISVIPQGTVTRTIWSGSIDLAGWSSSTQGTMALSSFDNIASDASLVLKIQYTATGNDIQLKPNTGDWKAVDLDNGDLSEHIYKLDPNDKEISIPLSAATIKTLKTYATDWGGLIIFNGTGAILTKISLEITTPQDKDIAGLTNRMDGAAITYPFQFTWGDDGRFYLTGEVLQQLGVKKGSKLLFYKQVSDKGQVQINSAASGWPNYTSIADWNQTEEVIEYVFDDASAGAISDGLAIQGDLKVTKITILP